MTVIQSDIVLWGLDVSPYVRKVKVALEEKGISYIQHQILPLKLLRATNQEIPNGFVHASPFGKIPAIQDGDFTLTDSAAINAYIEHKYSGSKVALYPSDSTAYAKVVWLERFADDILAGVLHNKIFVESVVKPKVLNIQPDQSVIEKAQKEEIPPLFDYIAGQLNGNDYLVNNQFTVADIAIVTHFIGLQMSGIEIDNQRWPTLVNYINKVLARDSFTKATPQ